MVPRVGCGPAAAALLRCRVNQGAVALLVDVVMEATPVWLPPFAADPTRLLPRAQRCTFWQALAVVDVHLGRNPFRALLSVFANVEAAVKLQVLDEIDGRVLGKP